jgi:hypothetical protein
MELEMTPAVRAKFPEMEVLLLAELAAHNLFPEGIDKDA